MDDLDSCSGGVADTAGGTLEACYVIRTALIVLCCMGDCLRIPMNVSLFFSGSQHRIVPRLAAFWAPSLSQHFFPLISSLLFFFFCRPNFWPSLCYSSLSPSPLLTVVVAEARHQRQVWPVQSFFTPQRERNILYWFCLVHSLFLSLFVSVSGRLFPDLCTNIMPAVFSISLFLIFPTSPLGFPKCLLFSLFWVLLVVTASNLSTLICKTLLSG